MNPHQPGDILGVLQPDDRESRLQVRYDIGGEYSVSYYYTGADYDNTITDNVFQMDIALPLITVEIGRMYE